MQTKTGKVITSVIVDILIAALIVGGWFLVRKINLYLEEREYLNAHSSTAAEETAAPAAETPEPEASPEPTAEPEAAEPEITVETESVTDAGQAAAEESGEEPAVDSAAVEAVVEETPEPVEDLSGKTEWQIRFAEHFTDEVTVTDNSYTSPNVSITITSGEIGEGSTKSVYYVADIYIASIDCLQSYFAHNADYPNRTALMPNMVDECGALLAINGDYCGFSFGGIVLRNGNLYKDQANGFDSCILFRDGSVECMNSYDYSAGNYEDGDIWQLWTFGPMLMDGNGNALEESQMNLPSYLAGVNPRTGFGYYEPGHYCFVVVDGRQSGYSNGIEMGDFAKLFEQLGCTQAYNLDGGGSTMMMYQGTFVNKSSTDGQRDIPDIILIKDIDAEEAGEQG